MSVKNIMEDIVFSTIEEMVKQEREVSFHGDYIQDIAAYVLNRIRPKYVTSERGVLHGKLESKFMVQERTDILFLIHEAMKVIRSRRDYPSSNVYDKKGAGDCFLPHMIGEVVEETSFAVIPDVKVSLLFNGDPAKMADESWFNPYITNKGTSGYYHFWPAFSRDEMDCNSDVHFKVVFSHPKFVTKDLEINVTPIEGFSLAHSKAIPIVLLRLKEGISSDFLFE